VPPRRLAILAAGVGSPSTKGSSPRRRLVTLSGEGGGPTTKGSAPGHRQAIAILVMLSTMVFVW